MVKVKEIVRVSKKFKIFVEEFDEKYKVKLPKTLETADKKVLLTRNFFFIEKKSSSRIYLYSPTDFNFIRDTRSFLREREGLLVSLSQQEEEGTIIIEKKLNI